MGIVNINGIDFSSNIVVGTYSVNYTDMFNTWTDANGVSHRQIIRKKVAGSWEMGFRNMAEYNTFIQHMESSKTTGGWIPCYLFVNNLSENRSCRLYFTYDPKLDRQHGIRNYIPNFTVTLEEV